MGDRDRRDKGEIKLTIKRVIRKERRYKVF